MCIRDRHKEDRSSWQLANLSFLNRLNTSDSLQKTISTFSSINSKKLSRCLSTQNESDKERIIFVLDCFAIWAAFIKAFLANSLSHKYPSKYKYLLSLITVKSISSGSNSIDAPRSVSYTHLTLPTILRV